MTKIPLGSFHPAPFGTLISIVAIGLITQLPPAHAQEKPATPPPPPTPPSAPSEKPAPGMLESFFNGRLPDVIAKSKVNVNVRFRYEFADQDGLKASHAPTVRTRFGLTSGSLYGFQGMLEAEDVRVIGSEGNYNAAGSNPSGVGKTIIADPPVTELNQAWLSYTNFDTQLKGGRQRIALDNHRFVGDVGWRQNQQTFDAVMAENKSFPGLDVFYGYVWDVRRVFGDVPGLPAANSDFDSDSHLLNASYSGWKYGKFVGYTYLLDLHNRAGFANSCATYGGSFAGSAPIVDHTKLDYRAEFAWQTDYARSPLRYGAEYYDLELGATVNQVAFGLGYEVLGSDNNAGFRTPLATLHQFNGWADTFLVTPAKGLRDLYPYVQVALPASFSLRGVYHKYDSATGGADYGQEFDVFLSKKLGKYWNAMAKYAHYDAKDAPYAGTDKVWLQVEFNY